MKKLTVLAVLCLSACAPNPNTGMNGLQSVGYALQCAGNGFCPPPPNASYEDRIAYQNTVFQQEMARQAQMKSALPKTTTCNKFGNQYNCTTY